MKDRIDKLIEDLKKSKEIRETKFSNTFLNEAGKIYEIHGYGAVKSYLIDKMQDKKNTKAARVILHIIDRIESLNIPKDIGSFIIRKINSIKYYR